MLDIIRVAIEEYEEKFGVIKAQLRVESAGAGGSTPTV
jgi:hypothetical protein